MLVCSLDCLPSLQLRSAWSRPSQTHSLSHTRYSEVGVVDSEIVIVRIHQCFFSIWIYLILGSYFYQRTSTFPSRSTLQNFGQHLFARKMPPGDKIPALGDEFLGLDAVLVPGHRTRQKELLWHYNFSTGVIKFSKTPSSDCRVRCRNRSRVIEWVGQDRSQLARVEMGVTKNAKHNYGIKIF